MGGNIKIIGWQGDPLYKEITCPALESEPFDKVIERGRIYNLRLNEIATHLRQTLRRTLTCLAKDAHLVVQQLALDNATISFDAPTPTGTSTINFGSGWKLKNYAQPPGSDPIYQQINAVYEREIAVAFNVGLPAGLTMTGANGVGTIDYDGTNLLTFNSGRDDTGAGWDFEIYEAGGLGTPPRYGADAFGVSVSQSRAAGSYYGINILHNGIVVVTVEASPFDVGAEWMWVPTTDGGSVPRVVSTFGTKADADAAAAALNAENTDSLIRYVVRDVSYFGLGASFSYGITVEQFGIFTNNRAPMPRVQWVKTGNVIEFKLYDNVTVWKWDVS